MKALTVKKEVDTQWMSKFVQGKRADLIPSRLPQFSFIFYLCSLGSYVLNWSNQILANFIY